MNWGRSWSCSNLSSHFTFIKLICYSFIHWFISIPYSIGLKFIHLYLFLYFQALGNLYFVHKTIDMLEMWNFVTHDWEPVEGKAISTGNIEHVTSKEKSKFPQNFFPECRWSRKGFLRTRWNVNGTVLDLVNIHLFHDASNLAACETFPSVYCKSRRRAFVHTLER